MFNKLTIVVLLLFFSVILHGEENKVEHLKKIKSTLSLLTDEQVQKKATSAFKENKLDVAELYFNEILKRSEKNKLDDFDKGLCYFVLGEIMMEKARFNDAAVYLQNSFGLIKGHKESKKVMTKVLDMLGMAYYRAGHLKEALKYTKLAIKHAQSAHGENSSMYAVCLGGYAVVLHDMKRLSEAIKAQEQVYSILNKHAGTQEKIAAARVLEKLNIWKKQKKGDLPWQPVISDGHNGCQIPY